MSVHASHLKPRTVLDAADQLRRGGWWQTELRSLMTGQDMRVCIGRNAGNDPHQNVLGPSDRHNRLKPVEVVRTVNHYQADAVLDSHGDLFGALFVPTEHDQRGIDACLECGEDLIATGDVESEPFLH